MKLRTWCIRSGQILAKPVLVFAGFLVFLTIFNPATIQAEDGRGTITIRHENVPIQKVFQSIEKQSGYRFFYNETLLQGAVKVTLHLQNVSLQEALDACFRNQPLSYAIVDKTIIVKRRPEQQSVAPIPAAVSFTTSKKGKLIAVRGKVTSNNVPVAGASIMIKGTDNGASTDKDGIFTLAEVDEEAVLVVSSVSHQAREVRLNGQTFISIDLSQKSDDLDEAVVVAYNTTTVKRNVGAVTVVKGSDIQNFPARSIDRALQGMVPGLQITSGSGLPGGNVSNITLRGIATGGEGISRIPLYVVDGTIVTQDNFNGSSIWASTSNYTQPTNPMAQINPNDIESISILKDAAAIALYGSQASNGVILITTKKGKAGKLKINFRHQTDLSMPVDANRKVLNQAQYLELLYESYKNANPVTWTDKAIYNDLKSKFPYKAENGDTSFYSAPDWSDDLYTDHALAVSNDLSFSGGNDKTTYFLSLGSLSQKGVLKNTGFNRSTLRYNMNIVPFSWLNIGINTSIAYSHQDYDGSGTFEAITSPNGFSYYVSPLLPIRQDNGNYIFFYPNGAGGATIPNPVARAEFDQSKANAYRAAGNIYGEISFLKHFSFRSTLGTDLLIAKNTRVTDKRVDQFTSTTGGGSMSETDEVRSALQSTNMLRYRQTFLNKHSVDVLVSQEAQVLKSNLLGANANGFTSGFSTDEISSGNTKASTGVKWKSTFLSYFAQGNYSYHQKYNASVGVRLDGSSRFGANVPLKKFWSFGAGWVLSDEPLLKKSLIFLDYLKIRGSVGVSGNTVAIPPSGRSNSVSGVYYSNNPGTYGSSVLLSFGNPDITPEQTYNTDLGLEFRLWKGRINVTTDIYKRKTNNMVYSIPEPFTTGQTTIFGNLGDMENTGIEILLSVDIIRNKNFTWSIVGNWSTNKNKLTKAYDSQTFSSKFVNQVGENYNSWYLVRWAGVDSADGSPQWYDKDGKVTNTYSTNDRVLVGQAQPKGFGSVSPIFRFKQFELNALLYYAYGYMIYNTYLENMLNDGRTQPYSNQSILALDRWQKPGDETLNPKRVLNNTARGNSASTRYLVDGDYIRLKNVMLTYSLGKDLVEKIHLTSAKVFLQASNLAFWSKSENLDPDNTGSLGENVAAYPQQKSFSFGLNLNF